MKVPYVLSPDLEAALEHAEITERPLLLKGEPGTGKTLLAWEVARRKKLPLFEWHVKSTATCKDGLYFYDAVTRLNDSRFGDGNKSKRNVQDIDDYIRLEGMGQAFSYPGKSILLIDEIDKGDIEFPNDLLRELDKMEFIVQETGKVIKAAERPFIIITSNNEKELPDAFLRRCIFHYIDFPEPEMMSEIVKAHFPDIQNKLLKKSMEVFYRIRDIEDLKKRPSTSEFIDWIRVLIHTGQKDVEGNELPFKGVLLKHEDDLGRIN